jgi:hypothetical protein
MSQPLASLRHRTRLRRSDRRQNLGDRRIWQSSATDKRAGATSTTDFPSCSIIFPVDGKEKSSVDDVMGRKLTTLFHG